MASFSAIFASAQTNTILIPVTDEERLTILRVVMACDNATTPNVGVTLSLGEQIFTGHPGIAPGSGIIEAYRQGDIEGGMGQPLTFSCEVPTDGSIRVSGSYLKHKFT